MNLFIIFRQENKMNIFFYDTNLGNIGIAENNDKIKFLFLPSDNINPDANMKESRIIREAYKQLDMYLNGKLKTFDLQLDPSGTAYMRKIYNHLCEIPYGETRTYKQIASTCGNPGGARAAGLIIGRNPIPIIIPCHRVIGSNGSLTGYRGGLQIKRRLLDIEKQVRQD